MAGEVNVVLDTCVLLWYTLEPDVLSLKAQRLIAGADRLVVCAVSVWEIGIKSQKKKLDLGISFEDYVDRISQAADLHMHAVDHRLWARSVLLDWSNRDPADRLIVTLAKDLQAPIVSDDDWMKEYYKRTVF